jgi:hypothetical protein
MHHSVETLEPTTATRSLLGGNPRDDRVERLCTNEQWDMAMHPCVCDAVVESKYLDIRSAIQLMSRRRPREPQVCAKRPRRQVKTKPASVFGRTTNETQD